MMCSNGISTFLRKRDMMCSELQDILDHIHILIQVLEETIGNWIPNLYVNLLC